MQIAKTTMTLTDPVMEISSDLVMIASQATQISSGPVIVANQTMEIFTILARIMEVTGMTIQEMEEMVVIGDGFD